KICKLIIEAWQQYFLMLKDNLIGHFTLDNAHNNDTAMRELSCLLTLHGIDFNLVDRHIICFPHVLNICSGHVTDEYMVVNFASISEAWVDALDGNKVINKDAYIEALQCDPIALGHDIVCAQLDDMDWQVLQDMEVVLKIPHSAQQCMLGESFPLLSHAVPSFKTFMAQWEQLSLNKPCFAPYIEIGLHHARSYYQHMGETNAYAIAMFLPFQITAHPQTQFNPSLHRFTWIELNWEEFEVHEVKRAVLNMMTQLRMTVNTQPDLHQPNELLQLQVPRSSNLQVAFVPTKLATQYNLPTMHAQQPVSNVQTAEQELTSYVTASCSPEGTDPLSFWAVSWSMYPTLYHIAMDYLPIQALAVPCECIFSSSAEMMTKRCNQISPILMEALQMLKFFFKKEQLNFTRGW
ncbi:hypothetical protein PISMIDRAFT_85242, partial [Pisolithus microcarpus 441]